MAQQNKNEEDDGEVFGPGLTHKEAKNHILPLELALLRVRHRHEDAGDAHKLTFGDLLREAEAEAQREHEQLSRVHDGTEEPLARFRKSNG